MIPKKYRKADDSVIATYDYTQIANGEGVVVYDGFCTESSGSVLTYRLTQNTDIYSQLPYNLSGNPSATSFTSVMDIDYDVEFNLPRTIQGTAYLNFSAIPWRASGNTTNYYIRPILRKVSDGVEEDLVSISSKTISVLGTETATYHTLNLPLALSGKVHFKKGDKLRLTMTAYGEKPAGTGGTSYLYIYNDPKNRTPASPFDGADLYTLKLNIPFDIQD